MTTRTAEEAEANYVEKMGDALGTQFTALWLEVEILNAAWGEYVELFTEPDSVEVLKSNGTSTFPHNSSFSLGTHAASYCAAHRPARFR